MSDKNYTYDKRLGWRNVKGAPCRKDKQGCGGVHEWMTRGCKPVIVPDQWDDGMMELEKLPRDIVAVRIGQ